MSLGRSTSRLQVGSAAWVEEERTSAMQLAESEMEEFTFAVKNELDWLNEHMAQIFDENQLSITEMFKTPGKLKGKTPRTIRRNPEEARAPLANLFAASPRLAGTPKQQVHHSSPGFKVAEDPVTAPQSTNTSVSPSPVTAAAKPASSLRKSVPARGPPSVFQDSGYHGSQAMSQSQSGNTTQAFSPDVSHALSSPEPQSSSELEHDEEDVDTQLEVEIEEENKENTVPGAYQSSQPEGQVEEEHEEQENLNEKENYKFQLSPLSEHDNHSTSPMKMHISEHGSPVKTSPFISSPTKLDQKTGRHNEDDELEVGWALEEAKSEGRKHVEVFDEEAGTPSDGSSPVRQVVRKSSLSFAALPAREPLTTKKSIGARASQRESHFEASRSSYYPKASDSKKSLGGFRNMPGTEDEEIDVDENERPSQMSGRTYTQRLQDQINMMGQTKAAASRLSKSISNLQATTAQPVYPILPREPADPARAQSSPPVRISSPGMRMSKEPEMCPSPPPAHNRSSPKIRSPLVYTAPGAFPEEDLFIGSPPPDAAKAFSPRSPRAGLIKSYSVDVMEDIRGKGSIGAQEFAVPKQREEVRPSPLRRADTASSIPPRGFGHMKSKSTVTLHSPEKQKDLQGFATLKKTTSARALDLEGRNNENRSPSRSPSKSSQRSYRGSPLKAAKDKLSSILKTSKGLFASSAAASADGMANVRSPSRDIADKALRDGNRPQQPSLYPALSNPFDRQSKLPESPSKNASLRKAREKEDKEAKIMAHQLNKLDREREKEAEKARQFSQQEKERVAAMERKIREQREAEERRAAEKREEESRAAEEEENQRRLARQREEERKKASTPSIPRPKRTSPRKTKAQQETDERSAAASRAGDAMDWENDEDTAVMPPPSTIGRAQIGRPKEPPKRLQRPTSKQEIKPLARAGPAPVVIRVNTGSRPFQPSTAALSASLGDSLPLAATQPAPAPTRPGQARPRTARSVTAKSSSESLKSAASTKVRALESAARKRQQDEREAQRKREAKLELASNLEAKRNAQRELEKKQAIEKAKMNRPPPPPVRANPHADREKPLPAPPMSNNERITTNLQRPGIGMENYNTAKAPPKRPLGNEDPRAGPQRNSPSYQQTQNDSKRRKTSDEYDFETSPPPPQPKFKQEAAGSTLRGAAAPPIRQSGIRKVQQEGGPQRSLFQQGGYANAPQQGTMLGGGVVSAIPQHMQSKPAKPPQGFSTNVNPHKTPARPIGPGHANGKSTAKTIRQFTPTGELIELPEIHTDSEDESADEGGNFKVPEWAESPNLAAGIIAQEGRDPMTVFGAPQELKMEEVFRNKERWGRFRQRTSSANWTGSDRLTEEEIKRDLEARERLRREGGWSYGLS